MVCVVTGTTSLISIKLINRYLTLIFRLLLNNFKIAKIINMIIPAVNDV
ncbi:hypothetical protein ClosIBUN22A_CONTIG144g02978 [Clostridium sp. IBUN22A]|nr:hypothetical protein CBDKU1_28950 [Clostridium butyricum DKU-01]KJZ94219.1 hypothetical protein ClosIBUN22A_CONTIG144g02978 [Clostridium sp. IBUN22A]